MVAAVKRVFVFALTKLAHLKLVHRRIYPVVGQCFDDGKSRSAVGAVYKWIFVAWVCGVIKLAQAVIAKCVIRQDGSLLGG